MGTAADVLKGRTPTCERRSQPDHSCANCPSRYVERMKFITLNRASAFPLI